MPLIQWDSSYSVNVSRCDDDHKKLVSLINALHEAMKAGKGASVVQKIAKELADYVTFHFQAEEALMQRVNYPGLEEQRLQHRGFTRKVDEIKADVQAGRNINTAATLGFLRDWLLTHIKQMDKKYSAHLNAHGIS